MKPLIFAGIALLFAGCGGSQTTSNTPPLMNFDPMFPDPLPAVLTAQDYLDTQTTFTAVDDLNRSSPLNLPAGVGATASFSGRMDAQFPLEADITQRLVGDVALDVTFTTRTLNNVTGEIDNLHIVQDGVPTELLTGTIPMFGQYNFTGNKVLDVDGNAAVTGTFGTDEVGQMRVYVTLRGDMRGTVTDPVVGVTGRTSGHANGDFGYPLFYSETSTGIAAGDFYLVRDGYDLPD